MTEDLVLEIFTAAVVLALKLAAPTLIIAMLVGLIIAILQAATQVHEQTLTFAPKAVVVALGLLCTLRVKRVSSPENIPKRFLVYSARLKFSGGGVCRSVSGSARSILSTRKFVTTLRFG